MILLRHGQSEFNLHFTATRRDPGIIDPELTELGHAQAAEAADTLAAEGISRIVVSPYTRALQTATPLARRLNVGLTVSPLVRERYGYVCDIGTPRSQLQAAWPDHDFSAIDEIWWPDVAEPEASIVSRAARFRAEQADRDDWRNTLVVCHWGFILTMTGRSLMNGQWIRCDPTEAAPVRLEWRA
jgi:glucosyl-3-phosphoglycerate phosphatase